MKAAREVAAVAERFKDRVEFVLVYLREAHPTDGWAMEGSMLADPTTPEERIAAATTCCKALSFPFPAIVDRMDDATAVRWSGWPERLFVISKEGTVVYTGDQGPFGFDPSIAYPGFQGEKKGISLEQRTKLAGFAAIAAMMASAAAPSMPNGFSASSALPDAMTSV